MRRIWIYIFSILFVAFISYLAILAKKYEPKYRVENLVIINNRIIPTEVLLEFIKVTDKETLKGLTADIILDRIEKYPYVKKVEGVFVDTITYKVIIEEVTPFFMAVTNLGKFIVTRERKILPEDTRLRILDLPVFTVTRNLDRADLNIDNKIFSTSFKSFENIYEVDRALFGMISEMNIDNQNNLSLYLSQPRGKIIAGNELDKLRSLHLSEFWKQVILNSSDEYEYIDLRFQDQIVVKKLNNS